LQILSELAKALSPKINLMLARVVRSLGAPARLGVRSLSAGPDNLIPGDTDHQVGRRKMEIDGATFNRDPIWAPSGLGTKENPVIVPSSFSERIVGADDPATAQLVWFVCKKGPLNYVECLDK
jgi:hypothetical protein